MRKTNRQLIDEFRALLTTGFYAEKLEGGERLDDLSRDIILRQTKAWRNEMWKAFREIEGRLDPVVGMKLDGKQSD